MGWDQTTPRVYWVVKSCPCCFSQAKASEAGVMCGRLETRVFFGALFMKFLERSEALEIIWFKASEVAKCPGWGFSRAAWGCARTQRCAGLDPDAGAGLVLLLGLDLV